ncbi:MAG: acyloxyacyl hydrolase [Candidatus Eiseniibacteriota bacterium]
MIRRILLSAAAAAMALNVAAVPAKADAIPSIIGVIGGLELIWGIADDTPQPDKSRGYLVGGGGYFDAVQRENSAGEFRVELQAPFSLWRFKPIVGLFGTTDKAVAGYFGLQHDLNITDNLVLSVNTGPAFYASGDGKDLGSWALLRSGLEISYRFDNAWRLSGTFHHMSHGKLFSDKNPGEEDAAITLSIPFDTLFGK